MTHRNPAATRRRRARSGAAATVHDVARLAEVSAITVSRAFHTPGQLSAKTLERVRAAIAHTGYTPNLLAGALRASKNRIVAAVVPTIAGPVFLETVQSLTDALEARDYQLLLGQGGYGASGREDALLDAIIGRRPAGIVLTGLQHSAEGRARLAASGIPIVETWDIGPEPIDMAVGFDHRRIGTAVCDYLWKSGRRHLAIVSGDDERARRRAQAFTRAARRFGSTSDPAVHWIASPTTLAAGREGLARLLERGRIDAVFCSSDMVALGVLTEAHARGIAVPKPLAVVGFGDLDFSAGLVPPLTTVSVDGAHIGATAAAMIIDRAEGRRVDKHVVDVGFTIVRRATA